MVRLIVFVACAAALGAGPAKLQTATWLGGPHGDEIVAVEIAPDGTILLAMNTPDFPGQATVLGSAGQFDSAAEPRVDMKKQKDWKHPSKHGAIVRLNADATKVLSIVKFGYGAATIARMKLDPAGNILVQAEATGLELPGSAKVDGPVLVTLGPDGKLLRALPLPGVRDFGVDANGDVVAMTGNSFARFAPAGGTPKWTATWKTHGESRPGGMALDPATGIAAVTGYGMTHTGKEPYKDPYAYAFDRDGKQVWMLWNPDPKKEKDAKFSTAEFKTNGLMADTTGRHVGVGADGKFYVTLYADGGNSVCGRDPLDVDKPLDKAVFDGVHQKMAGYGFKGASKTSVTFRVDPKSGALEKGTWLSAWLTPQRANGLGVDATVSDDQGRVYIVGNSASGCPVKDPWFPKREGEYLGGGFLAVMNQQFQLQQCGYFPAANFKCVAVRGKKVAVAGTTKPLEDDATKLDARTLKPLQAKFGGGTTDGYLAVFTVE